MHEPRQYDGGGPVLAVRTVNQHLMNPTAKTFSRAGNRFELPVGFEREFEVPLVATVCFCDPVNKFEPI
eukprot:4292096-Pyramimonas_sp.AAC.1